MNFFDISIFQYFLAIAIGEIIIKAAKTLHMTQLMFSKQLKNLENKVRKQLLIRDSKEVTLTEDSMLLRKCAEEIIDLVERTKTECSSSDKYISIDFIWEVVKWKPFL